MRINKIWQSHRASMKRSSHLSPQRANRLQLAVEDLEGRAMPSATLPMPTVETGAALHLKPIEQAPAVSHASGSGTIKIYCSQGDPSSTSIQEHGTFKLHFKGSNTASMSYAIQPTIRFRDLDVWTEALDQMGRPSISVAIVPPIPRGSSVVDNPFFFDLGNESARGWSVADDVVVDGRVITAPANSIGVGAANLISFDTTTPSASSSLPGTANLVRFNTNTPGTSHDDVFIDGWIITAPAPSTASSHELGHALGFRHEHVRPLAEPIQADWYFLVSSGTPNTSSGVDTNNHGTHVAGTIGAVGNNGTATTYNWQGHFRGVEQDDPMSSSEAPYQGKRSTGGYVPT